MREFMKRFDKITNKATAKAIYSSISHGLKHSQFAGAKEKFAKYGTRGQARCPCHSLSGLYITSYFREVNSV